MSENSDIVARTTPSKAGSHMYVSTPRDWGNIVRDRRAVLGLTQEELAARVGKARQWVVRFESGHAGSASIESLTGVLAALDLEVEVTETDEDPDPPFLLDVDDAAIGSE